MNRARALFFDFDSTLLDNRGGGAVLLATCQELASLHPEVDAEALREVDQRIFLELFRASEPDWTLGRVRGADLGRQAWRRALAELGCTDPAVLADLLSIHRRRDRASTRLFDDVRPFVESFRRQGVPLALITNSAADVQRPKLQALDITDWFGAIVISSEVGIAKPDPAVFEIALRSLGIERDGVWHIGDNPATDVAGARAAGLRSVWLNRFALARQEGWPTADIEVESLDALARRLRPATEGSARP